MQLSSPTKRTSAIAALPVAIAVEAGFIIVGLGGAVTAAAAFAALFLACHQTRLARWRRQKA